MTEQSSRTEVKVEFFSAEQRRYYEDILKEIENFLRGMEQDKLLKSFFTNAIDSVIREIDRRQATELVFLDHSARFTYHLLKQRCESTGHTLLPPSVFLNIGSEKRGLSFDELMQREENTQSNELANIKKILIQSKGPIVIIDHLFDTGATADMALNMIKRLADRNDVYFKSLFSTSDDYETKQGKWLHDKLNINLSPFLNYNAPKFGLDNDADKFSLVSKVNKRDFATEPADDSGEYDLNAEEIYQVKRLLYLELLKGLKRVLSNN
ncbi:MAG: hypothetical protein ABH832_03155 [bacterium]